MNDQQFEDELRALRPRPLTRQLETAIATCLPKSPPWRAWTAAAAASAACLLVAIYLVRTPPATHSVTALPPVTPVSAAVPDVATLCMYNRAIGVSMEAVEALLQRDNRHLAPARGVPATGTQRPWYPPVTY